MDEIICPEPTGHEDLRDDMLKVVRYKILFVRHEYEVAFPENQELVADNIDPTSFAAWKVAEFIHHLRCYGAEIPQLWKDRDYPPRHKDAYGRYKYLTPDGKRLKELPEIDTKYLRVYYEVLDRYPREKHRGRADPCARKHPR